MKQRLAAAALAAACLPMAGTVAQTYPPVVVTHPTAQQPVTFNSWVHRVQNELDKHIRYPSTMYPESLPTGIVRVKFNCSESGRPDKVTVDRSSGNRHLDQAAVRAVQRMASLHPLPASFTHDQKFAALILFQPYWDDQGDARMKKMLDEAARGNAWMKRNVIASGGSGSDEGVVTLAAR